MKSIPTFWINLLNFSWNAYFFFVFERNIHFLCTIHRLRWRRRKKLVTLQEILALCFDSIYYYPNYRFSYHSFNFREVAKEWICIEEGLGTRKDWRRWTLTGWRNFCLIISPSAVLLYMAIVMHHIVTFINSRSSKIFISIFDILNFLYI